MDAKGLSALCDRFARYSTTIRIRTTESAIGLLSRFRSKREVEKAKLPYHINLVDLFRPNENAHSKILGALLRQHSSEGYVILSSFYNLINTKNDGIRLTASKPKITVEKERIDLRILDKEYAVIIENKIHYAPDQPSQLGRYIKKIKGSGYPEENIYVIYLIRDENKRPQDDSWISDKNYKDAFASRFQILSYRNDILPWLNEILSLDCDNRAFKGAVEQYIDHLNGLFSFRNIDGNMNKELQEFLKRELQLGENPAANHVKITEKLADIDRLNNQLYALKEEMESKCWKTWVERLKSDYPSYRIIDYSESRKFPKTGIIAEYKGSRFSILIEKEQNIYYGFGIHEASDKLIPSIKEFLSPIMDMSGLGKENPWWYGWRYTSFENGFDRLKRLIDETIERLRLND